MKKFMLALISVLLVVCMTVPAFAADHAPSPTFQSVFRQLFINLDRLSLPQYANNAAFLREAADIALIFGEDFTKVLYLTINPYNCLNHAGERVLWARPDGQPSCEEMVLVGEVALSTSTGVTIPDAALANGIDLSLDVAGINAAKVGIMQLVNDNWEIIDSTVNGNTVTITTNTLNPIAVYVNADTSAKLDSLYVPAGVITKIAPAL